jgi:agmatine/peptidylarginine deiminase
MVWTNKMNPHYNELKAIYKKLKNKNTEEDKSLRFEDVPKKLSDLDKDGNIERTSYMEFYLGNKYHVNPNQLIQPSGLNAKNKNYNY